MGPYLFANAILVGFFAFGAIYHLILWSRSRDRVVLAFAALALVSAGYWIGVARVTLAD